MRIAIVSAMTGWTWGGSEELWFQMARAARRDGHAVAAMLCRPYGAREQLSSLRADGVDVLPRPLLPSGGGLRLRGVRLLNRIADPLRRLIDWRPDVVCVSQGGTFDVTADAALWPVADAVLAAGRPWVVVCQMNDENYLPNDTVRGRAGEFLGRAAAVLFVSGHNQRAAERQLARHLPAAAVVCNPVNLSDRSAVAWPGERSTIQLANVARYDVAAKGQDLLLEALATAALPGQAWHLNLYGRGPDEGHLRKLIDHFGLDGRVTLRGQVADVRAIWAESHLLALPSRFEGASLALAEAMLCGRPAVVTDVGGGTEWVAEPATGFVAPAASAASVAAALERAWAARDRWPAIGTAAHAAARSLQDPDPGRALLRRVVAAAVQPSGGGPASC